MDHGCKCNYLRIVQFLRSILECVVNWDFNNACKIELDNEKRKVLPGVEPRSLDSKSRVLTTTP